MRAYAALAGLLLFACSPTIGGDDDEGGDAESADTTELDQAAVDQDAMAGTDDAIAAQAPHLQAFFNLPKADGTPDATLENKVLELINGTPAGARIRIAMYQWSRANVANAVVKASRRGVDIQIVLDREANYVKSSTARLAAPAADGIADEDDDDVDAETSPVVDDDDTESLQALAVARNASVLNPAVKILTSQLPSGSVTFCTRGDGSCQGTHINHNKIYTFSTTGGAKRVVVQSSANLTTHHLHNALVISRGDEDLYNAYVGYFNDLKKHVEHLDYYRSERGSHTIAYQFPRKAGDTIVSILDNVHCTSNSHIYIAMAFFTSDRSAIADQLVAKKHAGCDVRVNMRHAGTNVSQSIITKLVNGGVNVGLYPAGHGTNIHSKYLIVDSAYATNGAYPHRKLVWTGSHNYTAGALRHNDEALLRVDDQGVFDAFVANWKAMRAQI